MSDDSLHSARLHLSEAAELAGTMASGYKMKSLSKALNRCNPINQHPAQPPAPYGENPFEGGNVGAPAQVPQYSLGSYPNQPVDAAPVPPPLPVVEYPGDTIPPALVDPCAGMKEALARCAPPSQYCPSFMGQPTGEVPPLAGHLQPLDTYESFTNQPLNTLGDPNRSLNDTLRQLWLRNHLQDRIQANQYTSNQPRRSDGKFGYLKEWEAEDRALGVRRRDDNAAQPSSHLDMTPQKARTILRDGEVHGHPLTDKQRGMFGAVAGRDDNAAYAQGHKPPGPGGGQFTGGTGESSTEGRDWEETHGMEQIKGDIPQVPPTVDPSYVPDGEKPAVPPWKQQPNMESEEERDSKAAAMATLNLEGAYWLNVSAARDAGKISSAAMRAARSGNVDEAARMHLKAAQILRSSARGPRARDAEQLHMRAAESLAKPYQEPTQNSAQPYSYPHNPDGRIQGPMQAVPESDFLGGRFGPGIKRMREQLANCRSR